MSIFYQIDPGVGVAGVDWMAASGGVGDLDCVQELGYMHGRASAHAGMRLSVRASERVCGCVRATDGRGQEGCAAMIGGERERSSASGKRPARGRAAGQAGRIVDPNLAREGGRHASRRESAEARAALCETFVS